MQTRYASEHDPAKQAVMVSNSDYARSVCHGVSGERPTFASVVAQVRP